MDKFTPIDDSNKDFCDADAGPSTVPTKRGRGRPKGLKNTMTTTKKPKTHDPDSFDAGPSTVPTKRGRGRPKGSKNPKTERDPKSKVVASCSSFNSGIAKAERETGNQELVDSVWLQFDGVRRRLLQINYPKNVLITAYTTCKNKGINTNSKKIIGHVPGVQIGDIFYYWGEMSLVGLHKQLFSGIDYTKVQHGDVSIQVAASVVTSGYYNDETEEVDTLIYTGQGSKTPCDQKLKRGNLALEASQRIGNEVRVIRGVQDPYIKKKKVYMYDGLYFVSNWWKVKGITGFDEFKFQLKRKPNQPLGYAIWKSVENMRKNGGLSNLRKGFLLEDLSNGKEALPVSLVNEVDETDKTTPPALDYVRSPNYSRVTLDLNHQLHICSNCRGHSCVNLDPSCICVQRNGGELAYHESVLLCRKPMVYECGVSCPCPEDCQNRVVQSRLKIHMEVFKTSNCGWGLRSWEPIRAGTFICEFVGLKKTKEEVKLEEDDDYLFDSSRIYNKFKWNYEPELVGEDTREQVNEVFNLPSQVLISAKESGNVSRFMNHSCSPNVFWQPIEYEMICESYLRIGFFAKKHIPPLTELTYDYGVSSAEKIGEDETLFKEKDDDDDKHDVVVNSWMHRLSKGHTVFFEEMYSQDVASRLGGEEPVDAVNEEIAAIERSGNPTMAEMVDLVNTMKKEMEEQRKETMEMVDGFGRRLASLEALVKEQVRQASADPSEEDIAGSTEPPNNQSGPSPQPPNELVGSSHDQGNDMNKRKGVKRTGVDENPSRRVTRSKKNVE